MKMFEDKVNELLQSNKLQFTLDIQICNKNDKNIEILNNKISINKINTHPFLDVKLVQNK